jgi:hypothetical protein
MPIDPRSREYIPTAYGILRRDAAQRLGITRADEAEPLDHSKTAPELVADGAKPPGDNELIAKIQSSLDALEKRLDSLEKAERKAADARRKKKAAADALAKAEADAEAGHPLDSLPSLSKIDRLIADFEAGSTPSIH